MISFMSPEVRKKDSVLEAFQSLMLRQAQRDIVLSSHPAAIDGEDGAIHI